LSQSHVDSAMAQITQCLSCVIDRNNDVVLTPFQNTGQEFDGSDSGAQPDEAVSWGKIRAGAESVKAGEIRLPGKT
jgi:deoxyhypusine synthase